MVYFCLNIFHELFHDMHYMLMNYSKQYTHLSLHFDTYMVNLLTYGAYKIMLKYKNKYILNTELLTRSARTVGIILTKGSFVLKSHNIC